MLPADVSLFGSFPPFVGTFEKTECEVAAVFIVRVLSKENAWRPLDIDEMSAVLVDDVKIADELGDKAPSVQRLMRDLIRNPFARPDFHGLVSRGYARWLGEPGKSALEFTPAGVTRLERWKAPPPVI